MAKLGSKPLDIVAQLEAVAAKDPVARAAALADLNPNYKFTTMAAAKKDFKNLAAAFKK